VTTYVALLRAVNVGGTGKLRMTELKMLCEAAGFKKVRTYIASGNVVFVAKGPEVRVRAALEAALASSAERPIGVLVRTAAEMAAIVAKNPFPNAAPSRTVAIFLAEAPPSDALEKATGQGSEKIRLGLREIYVHYGEGMATAKLSIPAGRNGTARNMNTVAKLAEMAADIR
jgi:uncharacterized protein (DUF1697 family)